jgi:hypothetical protein
MTRCNPYGWENSGGPNPAGGLLVDNHRVDESTRFHCGLDAPHRYRWVCSHENLPPQLSGIPHATLVRLHDGHASGEPVHLCDRHAQLLGARVGGQPVPCPRCLAAGPDHKCWLRLVMVS